MTLPRPCDCGRFDPGGRLKPDDCRLCWAWVFARAALESGFAASGEVEGKLALEAKRVAAGDAGRGATDRADAASAMPRNGDCIHLGIVLERSDARGVACACVGCWLRRCDLHGSCRVNDHRDSQRSCQECSDYEAQGTPGSG